MVWFCLVEVLFSFLVDFGPFGGLLFFIISALQVRLRYEVFTLRLRDRHYRFRSSSSLDFPISAIIRIRIIFLFL